MDAVTGQTGQPRVVQSAVIKDDASCVHRSSLQINDDDVQFVVELIQFGS